MDNENTQLCEMLQKAGFTDGYVVCGTELILWEHEAEPPKPLTRPEA